MNEHFLVRILRYGIYITAFVPLVIFSQFISPFHFGKVVVFRSIIEILFVFYLVLIRHNRSYLPSRNPIFWSFLGLTLAFGLTTATSADPSTSFWGFLERMGGFWSFLHYFVYFCILTSIFRKKEDWLRLLDLAIFIGFLSALYGFGQKTDIKFFIGSGGRDRIFGTIGNAALFAGYELIIAFLSLTLLFRNNFSQTKRMLYGIAFLTTSIALLMTAARGSILGLTVGLFIFTFLYAFAYQSKKVKKVLYSLVILAVIFLISSQALKNSQFIKSSRYLTRMTDISFESYTVQTRFWAWEAGLKGWDDNFKTIVFGWGPENFNIPFSKNFNPKFYAGPGSETLFDRAHNMFVEMLVTMGIIGFIAYISLFYFSLKSLWRRFFKVSRNEGIYHIGIFSLITAYIVHNAFFFDTSANFILFFTVLGFVSFISHDSPEVTLNNKRFSSLQALVGPLLLMVVLVLIYKTNIIPSKANYATTRGIVLSWGGNHKGAAEKFKESIAYDTFGVYEYRHRFAQLVFENYSKLNDEKYILDAIREIEKNVENHSVDYLPHLYLSRLNILLGKDDPGSEYNDIALSHAQKALKLSPTFVRAYYETGQAYLNKKQPDKAIEEFKKAIELNSDVGSSYWYWGVVEAERGNLDQAGILFEKAFTTAYPYSFSEGDLSKIVDIYVKKSDFKMLVKIYERLVSIQSKNPQYHSTLAYVYAKLGQFDQAVEEARAAVRLDSSYEAEAKAFLKAIGREL